MTELGKEGIRPWRFWIHCRRNNQSVGELGRPKKLTERVLQLIERKKCRVTMKLQWKMLGWISRGAAYCQLIRQQNKENRLRLRARENLHDDFADVWSDETTLQLETHRKFCCRKKGKDQKPRYKSRPEHPIKLHVLGWHQLPRYDKALHIRLRHRKKLQITMIVIPNFSLVLQPL